MATAPGSERTPISHGLHDQPERHLLGRPGQHHLRRRRVRRHDRPSRSSPSRWRPAGRSSPTPAGPCATRASRAGSSRARAHRERDDGAEDRVGPAGRHRHLELVRRPAARRPRHDARRRPGARRHHPQGRRASRPSRVSDFVRIGAAGVAATEANSEVAQGHARRHHGRRRHRHRRREQRRRRPASSTTATPTRSRPSSGTYLCGAVAGRRDQPQGRRRDRPRAGRLRPDRLRRPLRDPRDRHGRHRRARRHRHHLR